MVYLVDLPYSCKGYVRQNEDGTYTILLNSRLSYEENKKTFLHELSHIQENDFNADIHVNLLEKLRHK